MRTTSKNCDKEVAALMEELSCLFSFLITLPAQKDKP